MLNTALRRVARTCSSAPSPVQSRPATPAAASFTSHAHQRRHSSSKPPVPPNNGSSTFPPSVKQVGSPASDSQQATSESRSSKRRPKLDTKHGSESEYYNWTSTLPSVPSLQHMNPKDLYCAAFFGTHRPISITSPAIVESTMETVDKIFQPKPKKSRTASQDVIYTLSSAVENLDEQITNKKAEKKAHMIKALVQGNAAVDSEGTQHLDGTPQSINAQSGDVKFALQEFARRFRPYNVPPPPVPIEDPENAHSAAGEAGEEMQARMFEVEIQEQGSDPYIQQIVINVPKNQDLDNGVFFTSNDARIVEVENPADLHEIQEPSATQLGMVPNRRRAWQPTMRAISVKRQRKLKMKKHKFKKLTRRTRNLRLRQGKI